MEWITTMTTIRRPGLGAIMRTVGDGSTTGVLASTWSQTQGSSFAATFRTSYILLSSYLLHILLLINMVITSLAITTITVHTSITTICHNYIHSTAYNKIFKCHLIITIQTQLLPHSTWQKSLMLHRNVFHRISMYSQTSTNFSFLLYALHFMLWSQYCKDH